MLHRPPGHSTLHWQTLRRSDLGELDVLLTLIEDFDQLAERHSKRDLDRTFDAERDPGRHCRVGRSSDGTLVAYGWNHPFPDDTGQRRVHLSGGVHPDHRRRGAGHQLLRRQLEAAESWHQSRRTESWGPLVTVTYTDEHRGDRRRLYEELGLRPVRWYADMTRSLTGPLPLRQDPAGVRMVPLNRKRFEAVRLAHNEAFADHLDSRPVDREGWEKQLGRSESRVSWSWVALAAETSEVVGYATNSADPNDWAQQGFSEGWTDRLGVRPGWRGQGVARALLTASIHSFAEAGLDAAGLGVDSERPCGAFALYEQLGYRSTHSVVMYARTAAAPQQA